MDAALQMRLMFAAGRAVVPTLQDLHWIPSLEVLETTTKKCSPLIRTLGCCATFLTAAALCYERAGSDEQAYACATRSLLLDFEHSSLALSHTIVGRILCRKGEMEQAKASFMNAVQLARTHWVFLMGVGAMSDAITWGALAAAEAEPIIDALCEKMGTKRADYVYML
jgi:hypothetical protein